MMKKYISLFWIAAIMIFLAALLRLVIYPANFSPVIAMALFAGAVIKDKKYALALPLFAMFISDIGFQISGIDIGFWGWGQLIGYGILAIIVLGGSAIKKISIFRVLGFAIGSSLLFYLISNASVWLFDSYGMYARNWAGFKQCMIAGIPFIKNTMAATVLFSAVLFGSYYLYSRTAVAKVIA